MQKRVPAVVATALLLAASGLTGCSSGTAPGTVVHTPALKTTGGRATARSMVQAAIIATETSNGLALPGGLTPASAIRTMRPPDALTTVTPCRAALTKDPRKASNDLASGKVSSVAPKL